jgi:folate-dependent phosphoribosylglycinamide formyltransferase PurN
MVKDIMPGRIWVAMFSQTGTELARIQDELKIRPKVILTNIKDRDKISTDLDIDRAHTMFIHNTHDFLMSWLDKSYPDESIRKKVIITLHGYLRIIPPEICDRYEIYNGHPAAIGLYPELKGKDPQVRTWENNSSYERIGSVVHRVTPGVDEGEIVKEVTYTNQSTSLDDVYYTLRQSSFEAWAMFMREKELCA